MDLQDFTQTAVWLPLAASVLTGAVIGFEREVQAKAAGLRTHTLVCFSSAVLMMAASHQASWSFDGVPGANVVSDPTRMAHGILTGIGFLGAGVIFRQGPAVHGLTTAASLWMCAALGTLYGVGLFWLGLAGSVATLVVLVAFRIAYLLIPDRIEVVLKVVRDGPAPPDDIAATVASHCVRQAPWAQRIVLPVPGHPLQRLILTQSLWLTGPEDAARLTAALSLLPGVAEIAVTPVPSTDARA